jgi:hypothetical protein
MLQTPYELCTHIAYDAFHPCYDTRNSLPCRLLDSPRMRISTLRVEGKCKYCARIKNKRQREWEEETARTWLIERKRRKSEEEINEGKREKRREKGLSELQKGMGRIELLR